MFRKKNIIKSVRPGGYAQCEDTIIAVSNKRDLSIVVGDVQENFDLTFEVLSVHTLQSNQFVLVGYEKFQKGHLNDGVLLGPVIDGYTFSTVSAVHNAGIWSRNVSMSPLVIEHGLYDFRSDRSVWSSRLNAFFHFVDELLFSVSKGHIVSKINMTDGSLAWSFEKHFDPWRTYDGREKKTDVASFIGVENNRLWLALTNGTLLVLDVNTGNEIATLNVADSFKDQKSYKFFDLSMLRLDADRNVIIGLKMRAYLEIDVVHRKAAYYDLTADFFEKAILCSSGNSGIAGKIVFDSKHIYFIDKDNLKVGVFERTSRKIVWQYGFRSSEGNVMPMDVKISGSILCVLDSEGQIHVFERDGTVNGLV